MTALFSRWRHVTYRVPGLRDDESYRGEDEVRTPTAVGESNCISSRIADGSNAGQHTLLLDLDVPAVLIPSSTPGHSHLYVDVPMCWESLKRVLEALALAGVIEGGYAEASIAREHTTVRLPWIHKTPEKAEAAPF